MLGLAVLFRGSVESDTVEARDLSHDMTMLHPQSLRRRTTSMNHPTCILQPFKAYSSSNIECMDRIGGPFPCGRLGILFSLYCQRLPPLVFPATHLAALPMPETLYKHLRSLKPSQENNRVMSVMTRFAYDYLDPQQCSKQSMLALYLDAVGDYLACLYCPGSYYQKLFSLSRELKSSAHLRVLTKGSGL